jgi:hypothetical protein
MTRIDLVALQQRLAQQQPKPATPVRAEPPSWSTWPAPASALSTPISWAALAGQFGGGIRLRKHFKAAFSESLGLAGAGAESMPSHRFGCGTGGHAARHDAHARSPALESNERTRGTR